MKKENDETTELAITPNLLESSPSGTLNSEYGQMKDKIADMEVVCKE